MQGGFEGSLIRPTHTHTHRSAAGRGANAACADPQTHTAELRGGSCERLHVQYVQYVQYGPVPAPPDVFCYRTALVRG